MRYGRALSKQPPKKRRKFASLIIVAVILGIAAYFVGAGAAGGWLAKNVINPVFNSDTGHAADTASSTPGVSAAAVIESTSLPTASDTQSEEKITAQGITLYALQIGAFSDENNAKQTAQQVVARGGAGYIAHDGNLYRVLVAAYTSENDAKSVKDELGSQGVMVTVFKLESGALEFRIGAEQQQIDIVKACFDVIPFVVSEMQQIIFDTDKANKVDDRIAAVHTKAKDATDNLKAIVSTDSAALSSLIAYMDSLCEKLGGIQQSGNNSAVEFSSQLKYNLIGVVVDYSAFLKKLSS